jgi:hypothetical protein
VLEVPSIPVTPELPLVVELPLSPLDDEPMLLAVSPPHAATVIETRARLAFSCMGRRSISQLLILLFAEVEDLAAARQFDTNAA